MTYEGELYRSQFEAAMERLDRWEWFGMQSNGLVDPRRQLEHEQRKAETITLMMLIVSTSRLLSRTLLGPGSWPKG
jgi:hypothetical protein